jgi:DNA-binding NarL/FixJ family response regulator
MEKMPGILIVEPDQFTRSLITKIADQYFLETHTMCGLEDASRFLESDLVKTVDAVITEYELPGGTAIDLIKKSNKTEPPFIKVITSANLSQIRAGDILEFQVAHLLAKPFDEESLANVISKCHQDVKNGHLMRVIKERFTIFSSTERQLKEKHGLTDREIEIAQLTLLQLDNKTIALRLKITERTVKQHMTNIFGKLNVDSRQDIQLKISMINMGSYQV